MACKREDTKCFKYKSIIISSMEQEKFAYSTINENTLIRAFKKVETNLYLVLIFVVPFFIGHLKGLPNQIFVGATVNLLLVLGAFYINDKKIFALIVLPSIAALLSGIVFGPLSFYLLYLIPFIWAGNFLYVKAIRFLKIQKAKNLAFSIFFASIAKSLLLFSAAFALFSFGIIPEAFLTAMGILQLVTALIGGFSAGAVVKMRGF
jgi:hypothetical protein